MSVTPSGVPQAVMPLPAAPLPRAPVGVAAASPARAAGDRIEPSSSSSTNVADAALRGFGLGLVAGASAEAGVVAGLGATASAGAGMFYDRVRGAHPGAYAGAGAFAGAGDRGPKQPHSSDPANAIGAFAGAGIGAFVTNAGSATQLAGIAQTYSLNVGVGPIKCSLQFGAADGTYVGSVSIGPGIGADVSRYPINSAARSW